MRRDFGKRAHKTERTLAKARLVFFAIFSSVFLAIAALIFYEYHKNHFVHFPALSTWLANRKNLPNVLVDKAKQVSVNKPQDELPVIHFEFYTALPSMQFPADKKIITAEDLEKALSDELPMKKTIKQGRKS